MQSYHNRWLSCFSRTLCGGCAASGAESYKTVVPWIATGCPSFLLSLMHSSARGNDVAMSWPYVYRAIRALTSRCPIRKCSVKFCLPPWDHRSHHLIDPYPCLEQVLPHRPASKWRACLTFLSGKSPEMFSTRSKWLSTSVKIRTAVKDLDTSSRKFLRLLTLTGCRGRRRVNFTLLQLAQKLLVVQQNYRVRWLTRWSALSSAHLFTGFLYFSPSPLRFRNSVILLSKLS